VRWWLARYDIAYPTCVGYGRQVFLRAHDVDTAVAEARDLIARLEPGGLIKFLEVSSSSELSQRRHAARQEAVRRWLDNVRRGLPNQRGDL